MSTIVEDLAELNNKNQELKFELYEVEASLGHGIVDNPNVSVDEELKSEYFLNFSIPSKVISNFAKIPSFTWNFPRIMYSSFHGLISINT